MGVISGTSKLDSCVDQLTSPDVEINLRQIFYLLAGTVVHRTTAWSRRARRIGFLHLPHFLVNIEIGISVQNHCIYKLDVSTESSKEDLKDTV
jgi:hypothetical protein